MDRAPSALAHHAGEVVEAGDLDAAAAVVAALLSSQDERAEMLFKLQEFKQLPPLPAPYLFAMYKLRCAKCIKTTASDLAYRPTHVWI